MRLVCRSQMQLIIRANSRPDLRRGMWCQMLETHLSFRIPSAWRTHAVWLVSAVLGLYISGVPKKPTHPKSQENQALLPLRLATDLSSRSDLWDARSVVVLQSFRFLSRMEVDRKGTSRHIVC